MNFFVSKKPTNRNQYMVHKSVCEYLPVSSLRISLGEHYSCESAIDASREIFENSNGCFHCALLCHDVEESN